MHVMNILDAYQSSGLAEIILNTGLHAVIFSVMVALAIACFRRISPFILSSAILTALLLLLALPVVELSVHRATPAWWHLRMPSDAQAPHPAPPPIATLPIVQPDTAVAPLEPNLWERATQNSTTVINSLGLLWVLGILGMTCRLAFSYLKLGRLRKQLSPIRDNRVESLWKELEEKSDTHPPVTLVQINARCSPFAFGFRNPHIVIPRDMVAHATTQEIKDALLHEFNHIINRDLWMAVIQKVTLTLYWWNPVVTWLEQQFCLSREKLRYRRCRPHQQPKSLRHHPGLACGSTQRLRPTARANHPDGNLIFVTRGTNQKHCNKQNHYENT